MRYVLRIAKAGMGGGCIDKRYIQRYQGPSRPIVYIKHLAVLLQGRTRRCIDKRYIQRYQGPSRPIVYKSSGSAIAR